MLIAGAMMMFPVSPAATLKVFPAIPSEAAPEVRISFGPNSDEINVPLLKTILLVPSVPGGNRFSVPFWISVWPVKRSPFQW